MNDLFETGIRPAIDRHMAEIAAERRDYGSYWSASSAGYCMRRVTFDRLGVPAVKEDARKYRVFESGHIFHEWVQRITRAQGLSIAQELELQDEGLMVRGHIDDLVLVPVLDGEISLPDGKSITPARGGLILYDYKTVNSRAFTWAKKTNAGMSHYHRMQLGTYMYMLRSGTDFLDGRNDHDYAKLRELCQGKLDEARVLKISKDDLRMSEQQLMWSPELAKDVVNYWHTINGYWEAKLFPRCTCADYENGFAARDTYNAYFYKGKPCSLEWAVKCNNEGLVKISGWKAKEV